MNQDLIGKVYNRLKIVEIIPDPQNGKYKSWNTGVWVRCECECGSVIEAPLYGVQNGYIKSCGCYRSQKAAETLCKIKEQHPTPNAVYLTYNGKTMNIAEWAKETGIPRTTIMYRMAKEMPIEKILERKDDDYAYSGTAPPGNQHESTA